MTDLEMTRLCAEAMGIEVSVSTDGIGGNALWMFSGGVSPTIAYASKYDPLHDDAQAMALLCWIVRYNENELLELSNHVFFYTHRDFTFTQFGAFFEASHLRRAICECVAKMQSGPRKIPGVATAQ